MRVAVLSDIHGNCLALDAVLADIAEQGVDMTLNLGDVVSGPLEPARTADLLIERDFPTVRGNHDRVLVEGALDQVDLFARLNLRPTQLEWLSELPSTLVIGGEIFMCHGTPTSDTAPWLDNWMERRSFTLPDEAAVAAVAEGLDYPVLLCGHTHISRVVRLSDGRMVVNPGSVGLQMNYGSPDARYAIVERRGSNWSVTFRAVPYDHEAAARQAIGHGFPRWREVLTGGWAAAEGLF
ncbi:MAG: metallophosphoesterase family protein [Devosia sp.]